jgi:hypothetical protein
MSKREVIKGAKFIQNIKIEDSNCFVVQVRENLTNNK